MKRGTVDLSLLDEKVEELCAKILLTFPDCTLKTLEELRKPKLDAWNSNKENSRAWLALNMMTEARAGFTAFNEGPKDDREADFVLLRQELAARRRCGPRSSTRPPAGRAHGRARPMTAATVATVPRLARARRRAPAPAPGAAEGQPGRRRDDRGAARRARRGAPARTALRGVLLDAEGPHFSFGASVEEHLPDQCAEMLARVARAAARMLEFPAPCWSRCAASAWAAGSSWRSPGRRSSPRRTRSSASPRSSSACSRRPRRAAAVARRPRRRRGPAPHRPLHRRRRGAAHRPGAARSPTTPRPRRSLGSTSTCAKRAASSLACAVAAARADLVERVGASSPKSSSSTSTPDAHPRRQRGPRRLPGEAPARLGGPLMTIDAGPRPRSSIAARSCSTTSTSRPSRNGRRPCPGARSSATCRSTCRAS